MSDDTDRGNESPFAGIDLAGAVDRLFDIAEQTLAAQREFALALVGLATRQGGTAAGAVERAAAEAAEVIEATTPEPVQRVEEAPRTPEPRPDPKPERRLDPKPASQPGRRSYEERSVQELRERARELQIEGRSSMSKQQLIAALRRHSS